MKTNQSTRQALYQAAARLFYQRGYRATGVDTISAEAGIGKMSLYRYYPSKDELISDYLQESDRDFWINFDAITAAAPTSRGKLLAFFNALQEYVTGPACYGCPFINLSSEYPQQEYPGHQIALNNKKSVQQRFTQLAEDAGADHPAVLADGLLMLMDGAYIAARIWGASPENPARNLTQAAEALVDSHLNPNR